MTDCICCGAPLCADNKYDDLDNKICSDCVRRGNSVESVKRMLRRQGIEPFNVNTKTIKGKMRKMCGGNLPKFHEK
jgi:hypothetical protein